MVVDDDKDICYITRMVLEKAGYEVIECNSGIKCLEKLKEGQDNPDLVLMDLFMPEMKGWDVCRKIKADERLSSIPVALFTVLADQERLKEVFSLSHCDAYIGKPFDMEMLVKTVDGLLKK